MRVVGVAAFLTPLAAMFAEILKLYATSDTGLSVGFFMQSHLLRLLIPACILLSLPGACVWLAGWVLDGFAKDATSGTK